MNNNNQNQSNNNSRFNSQPTQQQSQRPYFHGQPISGGPLNSIAPVHPRPFQHGVGHPPPLMQYGPPPGQHQISSSVPQSAPPSAAASAPPPPTSTPLVIGGPGFQSTPNTPYPHYIYPHQQTVSSLNQFNPSEMTTPMGSQHLMGHQAMFPFPPPSAAPPGSQQQPPQHQVANPSHPQHQQPQLVAAAAFGYNSQMGSGYAFALAQQNCGPTNFPSGQMPVLSSVISNPSLLPGQTGNAVASAGLPMEHQQHSSQPSHQQQQQMAMAAIQFQQQQNSGSATSPPTALFATANTGPGGHNQQAVAYVMPSYSFIQPSPAAEIYMAAQSPVSMAGVDSTAQQGHHHHQQAQLQQQQQGPQPQQQSVIHNRPQQQPSPYEKIASQNEQQRQDVFSNMQQLSQQLEHIQLPQQQQSLQPKERRQNRAPLKIVDPSKPEEKNEEDNKVEEKPCENPKPQSGTTESQPQQKEEEKAQHKQYTPTPSPPAPPILPEEPQQRKSPHGYQTRYSSKSSIGFHQHQYNHNTSYNNNYSNNNSLRGSQDVRMMGGGGGIGVGGGRTYQSSQRYPQTQNQQTFGPKPPHRGPTPPAPVASGGRPHPRSSPKPFGSNQQQQYHHNSSNYNSDYTNNNNFRGPMDVRQSNMMSGDGGIGGGGGRVFLQTQKHPQSQQQPQQKYGPPRPLHRGPTPPAPVASMTKHDHYPAQTPALQQRPQDKECEECDLRGHTAVDCPKTKTYRDTLRDFAEHFKKTSAHSVFVQRERGRAHHRQY